MNFNCIYWDCCLLREKFRLNLPKLHISLRKSRSVILGDGGCSMVSQLRDYHDGSGGDGSRDNRVSMVTRCGAREYPPGVSYLKGVAIGDAVVYCI